MDSQSDIPVGTYGRLACGQILADKYRIERVIGKGGMGLVLEATQMDLQRRVAVKVLLVNGNDAEKTYEARFLREARVAAALRSENVVQIYDHGRLEDGCPYIVMEMLDGCDLSRGPMGPALAAEEAVDYLVQVCDAMTAAHSRGLVHRDLKPANLFLVHDEYGTPIVKVLDFGISKLRRPGDLDPVLTEANGLVGSPAYMSPEQACSARDVDERSDIWSLGTILYELLTGTQPFTGETVGAVFVAAAHSTPKPISELRPGLPKQLEAVVKRCLEKNPDARFQQVQDLQNALLPFASPRSQARVAIRSGQPVPVKSTLLSSRPSHKAGVQLDGGRARPAGSWRLRPWLPLVGGSVAVLVVVGFGTWARGQRVVTASAEMLAAGSGEAPMILDVPRVPASAPTIEVLPVASAETDRARTRRARTPVLVPNRTVGRPSSRARIAQPEAEPSASPSASNAASPTATSGAGLGTMPWK